MAYLHRAADPAMAAKPSALQTKRHTSCYRRPTVAAARDPLPPSTTIPASYPPDSHRPSAATDDTIPRRRKTRLPQVVPHAAASFLSDASPPLHPASLLLQPAIGRRGWAWVVAEWYLECLDQRPLLTKATTSALMHVIGDVLAQTITGVPVFDVARCIRFAGYGFCISAPANHYWHKLLEEHISTPARPKSLAILYKVAADQLLFAPTFTLVFYTWMRTLEVGAFHPDLIVATLQLKFVSTLLAKWSFWPGVSLFNFRYVPQRLRVFVINVFGILWSCYISMVNAQP